MHLAEVLSLVNDLAKFKSESFAQTYHYSKK